MLKRIITAIISVVFLLVPAVVFSHTVVFPIAVGLFTVVSIFEMAKCVGFHKKHSLTIPLYVFGMAVPFLIRYVDDSVLVATICFVAVTAYIFYMFVHIIWSHSKIKFTEGAVFMLSMLYIIASFASVEYIRDFENGGKYLYFLIFIGAWITDIFAYFCGKLFGKHKLIEDVSPKKTIEGSIGGMIFCSISFVLFGAIANHFFEFNSNLIFLAVCGVIASIVSQVGDLIMSVIKRHYGIKDYGKVFPGHGGVLDRFDSVLAVSLALAAVCMLSNVFGINMF